MLRQATRNGSANYARVNPSVAFPLASLEQTGRFLQGVEIRKYNGRPGRIGNSTLHIDLSKWHVHFVHPGIRIVSIVVFEDKCLVEKLD